MINYIKAKCKWSKIFTSIYLLLHNLENLWICCLPAPDCHWQASVKLVRGTETCQKELSHQSGRLLLKNGVKPQKRYKPWERGSSPRQIAWASSMAHARIAMNVQSKLWKTDNRRKRSTGIIPPTWLKGDDRSINSPYLLGQCLGPRKVGPYYVRHVKAEQVSAPKRLTLSLYKVGDRRIK